MDVTSNTTPATPRAPADRLWTVPNALSFLRVPLAVLFVAVESVPIRAIVLTAVALTDALDGWIARTTGQTSRWGALLDAAFDKIFAFVAVGTFLLEQKIGVGAFLVLISRDLYIAVGFLVSRVARWAVPVSARAGGKVVTVLQVATLYVLLLGPSRAVGPAVWLVGLASAYAIVDYTRTGARAVRSVG